MSTQRIPLTVVEKRAREAVFLEIVSLRPGEHLELQSAFHFRVLRGAVEFNGHVYTPRTLSYTKVVLPKWQPPERMLALCAGGSGRPRETGDGVSGGSCEDCRRVLAQQVLGGTCCDVRARHAEDDALMERHFNVGKRSGGAVEVADDPDVEALKHHEAEQQTEGAETTVVAIVPHRSAFGSVDIGRVFAAPGRPKIVVPALVRAARALLEVCARGERPPVLMLHGDKGAGKSTAAVYIVNYLLNHVGTIALLDTDVGQPIFGPPATVSLKFVTEPINAAPHALLAEQRPEVAYLLGDVKVTNPATMLRHTHKCFEIYRNAIEDDRGVPLVVNTFGWVSGLGAKMLECIGAITRTAVMLKLNTKQPSGDALPTVSTHRELETVIAEHTTVASEGAEPSVGPQADVLTMYRTVVEECGATLPWDRSGCVVIEALSHTQASALVAECVDSLRDNYGDQVACSLGVWRQARVRRGGASADPAPGDLRWLRACALINPSFGDCLHFPQLQQEEFFGAVGTPAFRRYVRYPELFRAPRQMVLMAEKFSFVVQINTPLERLEEVCPVVAGSMVALCCGHSERTLGNEVGEDWEFVAFVYVHYLNAEDMTVGGEVSSQWGQMLVSRSEVDSEESIARANIAVLCQTVGLDTIPTRICSASRYPSLEGAAERMEEAWKPREVSATQFVPFRRNNLLHMINAQGAGNSAGNSRKNIKRHKQEPKRE